MGQTLTCLHYHLVFSTKNRLPQITADLRERLYAAQVLFLVILTRVFSASKSASCSFGCGRRSRCDYMGGIIKGERGHLFDAGGTENHVHLLASFPAHLSVADFLRLIKTNSSKWVHETFAQHRAFAWQSGYGAFSVSRSNDDGIRQYTSTQQEHHRRMTFQQEFLEFLHRHEVPYDERYIWE